MRRVVALAWSVLVIAAVSGELLAENRGFVSRDGMGFEVRDRPTYYMGASYFNAMNYGAGDAVARAQLASDFAGLAALGFTNARIWASSEGLLTTDPPTPTSQPTARTFDDTLLARLDDPPDGSTVTTLPCTMALTHRT